MKPLVCIFAHPDDEAFGPAGSIAQFARQRDVYIVCATNGEAASGDRSDELGQIRRNELLKAAKILEVKGVEFLDFNDGTLCNNLYHALANKIQAKLEKYKPDTVLTYEPKGISGHIDHITVSLVTTFVFKKLSFTKKLMYYCQPKKIMREYKNYFIYMPPGYDESEANEIIDTSSTWDLKLQAMKAHKSQQHDADRIIKVISKFPKKEYFLLLKK